MLYKIHNRFKKIILITLFLSTALLKQVNAQQKDYTRPPLVSKYNTLKKQVAKDSLKRMLELKSVIPAIVYDLRYATTNNFTGQLMYPANTHITFMRLPAVNALKKVQQELGMKGLGLKIFDAYRPYSVTEKFWELIHDERYVAFPGKGSGHNRGVAVDLTIINLNTGKELDMGTGFDNFTDTAHWTFKNLPSAILQNRQLLRSVMEKHGFVAYEMEWWHYYLPESEKYEVLDIKLKKLKKVL